MGSIPGSGRSPGGDAWQPTPEKKKISFLSIRVMAQNLEKVTCKLNSFLTLFFQVSWHWKNLTELDQLWMLKCLLFNWYINVSPTAYEQGVWKKHYIQMVKELHVTKPKVNLEKEELLTSAT